MTREDDNEEQHKRDAVIVLEAFARGETPDGRPIMAMAAVVAKNEFCRGVRDRRRSMGRPLDLDTRRW